MSWTPRFALGVVAALALMAIETDWYGLLPRSSHDVIADASVLALTATYAARVSPVGAGIALFSALWLLYLDQATIGLGVPALPFVPPIDFWVTTVLRAALAWGAFGLVTGLVGRRVPQWTIGMVIAGALLALPFLRYNEWDNVLATYADPLGQRFVVLTVPWLSLVVLTGLIATAIALVPLRRRRVALAAVALLAVGAPLSAYAYDNMRLSSGLEITPQVAGPLDKVTLRATFAPDASAEALWGGAEMTAGPGLAPRPMRLGNATTFTLYPGAQREISAGDHDVALIAGLDARRGTFRLLAPTQTLTIVAEPDGSVGVRGAPGRRVQMMVRDDRGGAQLQEITLDRAGAWRADLPLPPGRFRLTVASGSDWSTVETAVR